MWEGQKESVLGGGGSGETSRGAEMAVRSFGTVVFLPMSVSVWSFDSSRSKRM